jgi:hypothetical protein
LALQRLNRLKLNYGYWTGKIGSIPKKLSPVIIESENLLEEQIVADISILNPGWMIIG